MVLRSVPSVRTNIRDPKESRPDGASGVCRIGQSTYELNTCYVPNFVRAFDGGHVDNKNIQTTGNIKLSIQQLKLSRHPIRRM